MHGLIANNRSDKRTRGKVQQPTNRWTNPSITIIIKKQLWIHLQIQLEH